MTVNVLHNVLFLVFLQRETKKRQMETQSTVTKTVTPSPDMEKALNALRERKRESLKRLDEKFKTFFKE